MGDVPTWVWQVLAAVVGGLGLGVGLGAVMQRGKKRAAAKRGSAGQPASSVLPTEPTEPQPARAAAAAPRAGADNTPQHRLLERLRENNLQLTAQLRTATEEHARQMLDKTQEQQAERFRQERQIEELRQTHAAELSHLMSVLVEQVDLLHRHHADHTKALEAEIERARGERRDPGSMPTTPVDLPPLPPLPTAASIAARLGSASNSPPAAPAADHAATENEAAEFAPTQVMDQARQS